jgi:ABC-type nitrate/sulfonate/bicarbonate transport system substrate-binding protein
VVALLLILESAWSAPAATRLQVATSGGANTVMAVIARQLGYFRALDLDVVLFEAGGGNNAVSTVVGGDAQIGVVGIRNASKPVEKGQPLKVIATDTSLFTQYIVVRPDLPAGRGIEPSSPLSEKGKVLLGFKVGVNDIGGSTGEFARYALAAAGYGDRAATIININSAAARLSALKGRRIDAIVAQPPEPETAVVQGFGTVLVDPARDLPDLGPLTSDVHVVRADFLGANGAVVRNYLLALERARRLVKSDPEAAKRAYYDHQRQESQGNAVDPKIADLAWKTTQLAVPDALATSPEQYANAQKFFRIAPSVTYERLIDNSAAEAVVKGE